MAVSSDSRYKGYLLPNTPPPPVEGDPWMNVLHDVVMYSTGLDGSMIRPRWQQQPPNTPEPGTNWCAFGMNTSSSDWQPVFFHVADDPNEPDGYDLFQRMETFQVLFSFYGPSSTPMATAFRDGLFIDQNAAELRSVFCAVVEVQDLALIGEIYRQQWRDRTDVPVILRREIRRIYPVRTLLRSTGTITANAPFGSDRIIETDYDTDRMISDPGFVFSTVWDEPDMTYWDDNNTEWDASE
jgi:hypothetical protein